MSHTVSPPVVVPIASANPCLNCGACCGFFRVSFHWSESTAGKPDGVPEEMTSPVTPHRVAMIGTLSKPARCVALCGEIGKSVMCTIHPARSSVCRAFDASWEKGVHNPDCDRARAAHDLPPLEPGWWQPDHDGGDHTPDQPTPLPPRQPRRAA